jgi:glycosidase
MNYPFAGATISFLRGHMDAYAYRRFLVSQSQNYPREMYYALMNLLSSHDVVRIRTALSRDVDPAHLSREDQAAYTVSAEEDRRGGALQRIAVAIQFALPGIPAVYYGDEVGMTGMLDPFNRQPYQPRDTALMEHYKKLSALRNENRALQTGHAVFYSTNGNVLGIMRFILNGRDAFGNPGTDDFILMVCNPADISHRIVIDLHAEKECLTQAQVNAFREIAWSRAISVNGANDLDISGGLLEISLPPLSAEYYRLTWTS